MQFVQGSDYSSTQSQLDQYTRLTLVAHSSEDLFDFITDIHPACQLRLLNSHQHTISGVALCPAQTLQSTSPPPRCPQYPAYLHIAQSLLSPYYVLG